MKPNQVLGDKEHEEKMIQKNAKFPLLKYTIILVIVTTITAIASLFYTLYQQKKQNEQFQAEALEQEKQDQISVYKETLYHEKIGFEHIMKKDYAQAIGSFYKANALTPSFHDVEEIAFLLSQHKNEFNNSKVNMAVLTEIVQKHAQHAPVGFVATLKTQIEELNTLTKHKEEKEHSLKRSTHYEQEGFTHLLNEEYNLALSAFQKANQYTKSFNDIPKLISLLNKHRYEMADTQVCMQVLGKIVDNYSTYAPEGFEEVINTRINYGQKLTTSKQTSLYEQKGFKYLIQEQYDKAIVSFENAHQLTPNFHDTHAIAKLLKEHQTKMHHFKVKREVFKTIMDNHAQHAPEGFVATITQKLLQEQKEVQALAYEEQGFHYLMKANYPKAMNAFHKASLALPSFHDVKALATLLSQHQEKIEEYETKHKVLNELLDNYTQYAPSEFVPNIKKQLKELVKPVAKSTAQTIQPVPTQQPLLRLDYSMSPQGVK